MGIQVVHDKYDSVMVWVANIHKIFYFLCPVNRFTVFPHTYMLDAAQKFYKYKDIAGPIPNIFGIRFSGIT